VDLDNLSALLPGDGADIRRWRTGSDSIDSTAGGVAEISSSSTDGWKWFDPLCSSRSVSEPDSVLSCERYSWMECREDDEDAMDKDDGGGKEWRATDEDRDDVAEGAGLLTRERDVSLSMTCGTSAGEYMRI
jgi:hypothetical protein